MTENNADQPDAMAAEFDTVAQWTLDAVRQLGPDYALPAACRGSGSPAALRWLAGQLELSPGERMLDSGAGVGGPAAFAAQEFGVRPVLAEPMEGACQAADALFGLPVVTATAEQLPFRSAAFGAGWMLGVLCTLPGKLPALTELRRVLGPAGRLGLIVYLRMSDELPGKPDGNEFPAAGELAGLLASSGFTVRAQQSLDSFGPAPDSWQRRAQEAEQLIAAVHAASPAWAQASDQQQAMADLLASGRVAGRVVYAVAVS